MSSMKPKSFPSPEDMTLERVLYALSDPTRMKIVKYLAQNREQPCAMCYEQRSKSAMSHHFKVLREAGLLLTRPEGTSALNSLRYEDLEARFPGLLDAVLRAAES